ncbi:hypothetical protein, partial [Streptomyces sp. AS02]|uniref:hypothetical protein n=1 Tax=Streptomyces sp. AS02 TaxID=2938946 RepID=UPI00202129A6
ILEPAIVGLVNFLQRLVNAFVTADPAVQKTIVQVLAFAAAVGPLAVAIGGIIVWVMKWINAFKLLGTAALGMNAWILI